MFVSQYQVFLPAGQKARKNSNRIANALFVELANYGLVCDNKIIERIASYPPPVAKQFAQYMLDKYTAGDLQVPLFDNWEARSVETLGERIMQLFEYMGADFHSDMERADFTANLKQKVVLSKAQRITLATQEQAEDRFNKLIQANTNGYNNDTLQLYTQFAKVFTVSGFVRSDAARVTLWISSGFDAYNGMQLRAADVLRYFAMKHDVAQVTLPFDVMYAQLTWADRKGVMEFLGMLGPEALMESMGRNRGAWARFIRHAKLMRQKEFVKKYPMVLTCFHVSLQSKLSVLPKPLEVMVDRWLTNDTIEVTEGGNLAYRTFASRVDTALASRKFKWIHALLHNQPAYLLRNLTKIATAVKEKKQKDLMSMVYQAISVARPDILFSLAQINCDAEYRIIDMAGNTTIDRADYPQIVVKARRAAIEKLRKTYGIRGTIIADPSVAERAVPFLSKTSALGRGSRISLQNSDGVFKGNNLYFSITWAQPKTQRIDLDHSWLIIYDNGTHAHINFGTQVNSFISQSGDITDAPEPHGASEYSRIQLGRTPSNVKYIVPVVHCFTSNLFSDCTRAHATFHFSNSDSFQVQQDMMRYPLNKRSGMNCPFVIDLQNSELIVVDYNISDKGSTNHTVQQSAELIAKVAEAARSMQLFTVGRFAEMFSLGGPERLVVTETGDGDTITPEQLSDLIT